MAQPERRETLHATSFVLNGKGVLIRGPSGSGKSTLALEMLQHGAELIADDRTDVTAQGPALWLSKPKTLPALLEVRGLGLIPAPFTQAPQTLHLVVDRGVAEADRLPPKRSCMILGREVELLHNIARAHFNAALAAYLIYGRRVV